MRRGLLGAGMLAALGAGALTAVLVAGASAGAPVITIEGANKKAITIDGSSLRDQIFVDDLGAAADPITIVGENRALADRSPACAPDGQTSTVFCDAGLLTDIVGELGKGSDRIRFDLNEWTPAITVSGGDGGDAFQGGTATTPYTYRGGRGGDDLAGGSGDDELRGEN